MIIDQRIKRKHIFTACNRTCMESRLFLFLKSRTADFGNTILIATKKVQLQRTQKGNLASEFIQPKAYII